MSFFCGCGKNQICSLLHGSFLLFYPPIRTLRFNPARILAPNSALTRSQLTDTHSDKSDKFILTKTKEQKMAEKTDNTIELHAKIIVDAGDIDCLINEGYHFFINLI